MSEPSFEMQKAVYAALSGSSALLALLGGQTRIYDKVVANPVYPFLRIGDDQSIDDANSCGDAWEVVTTIHVFSRAAAPRTEVKQIGNQVVAALLPNGPSPTGFICTEAQFRDFRTFFEADQATAHGVMTFRFLVDPAS